MQCIWLVLMVGLIMNEAMESSHIHILLAEVIQSISLGVVIQSALIPDVCRHQVHHWPGQSVACVGARWPAATQHTMAAGQCVCVCVRFTIMLFPGWFQCLQPLLTLVSPTPSPLLPCVCSDSLWSQSWVGGWNWMGSYGWGWWGAVWGSVGGKRVFPLVFWMATLG